MVISPILTRMFALPQGWLGRLGAAKMTRMSADAVQRAVSLLDLQQTDYVLEIGFGPGVGIERAAQHAAFVAGIDYSPMMVELASQRNSMAIYDGRVKLRYGTATALPYHDAMFDKALSMNSLHLWQDRIGGLKEIHLVISLPVRR